MFTIQVQSYDHSWMKAELVEALHAVTELDSRKRLPTLWRFVDWLNRSGTRNAADKPGRRIRHRIYGFILLALGLFLLVPGLMSPKELAVPLVAGLLASLLGVVYLKAGSRRGKASHRMKQRFEASADKLLESLRSVDAPQGAPLSVSFDEDGMTLPGGAQVPYSVIDLLVETPHLLVLIWEKQVTALQKSDIVEGTSQALVTHLASATGKPVHACAC